MKFENRTNSVFNILTVAASLSGLCYLVFRMADIHLVYQFMLGRNGSTLIRSMFPFLVCGLDFYFVMDQILFSLANRKYRLPRLSTPNAPVSTDLPFVTVLIPSYNEPVSVVEATIRAAASIDYPTDSFEVLFLDDGGNGAKEFLMGSLQEQAPNLRYLSRVNLGKDRKGFKAGNLNFGISNSRPHTKFFLLLDADQVCLSKILQDLIPYARLTEPKSEDGAENTWNRNFGFVQAPQSYQIGAVDIWDRPCREFHNVTQAYRSYMDSVMLTGTGVLIGAEALRAVENFDERTITEDILTGAKIQASGYDSYFHPGPVAYGLVPETLRAVTRQRLRWAQGSFQLVKLWTSFAGRLSWRQKLCYMSGVLHFLFGFPSVALSLLPATVLYFDFDSSLHYSNSTLVALAFFVVLRYLSREAYCGKFWVERGAANYLNLVFGPVYIYAFFTAMFQKSLQFETTPKGMGIQQSRGRNSFFQLWPLLIGIANLLALIILIIKVLVGGYPFTDFVVDYSGLGLLTLYFLACGVTPSFLGEKLFLNANLEAVKPHTGSDIL